MTDKTQATAHACIKPQCDPAKCSDCACAITPTDEASHVVLGLLNTFAVNDLGHPFEGGDSAAVDRARQWLQNRSTALQAAPPAPAAVAVAVPAESALVPIARLKNARALVDRGFWNEGSKILDELIAAAPAQEHATQLAAQGQRQGVWLKPAREGRVYVAGPMTGWREFNFPAFHAKAAELRAGGWHVENPADHGHVDGAEWADYLHYDIGRMATCGAIHLLPGWSRSRGAALEVHIASALGLEFQYAEGAERAAPAQAQEHAPIVWPKSRDVGRIGDMSTTASLRVGLDGDNDSYVNVWDENGGGSIEFCTPGAGGGKSRRTRVALLALMVAMEADNAEDPRRDWWAARAAQGAAL